MLAAAVANQEAADRTYIEWEVGGNVWQNLQQIQRQSFGVTGTEMATKLYGVVDVLQSEQLAEFLRSVEQTLRYGTPQRIQTFYIDPEDGEQYSTWRYTCGGLQAYARRADLIPGDRLALRPLRDLELRSSVQAPDDDEMAWEYLAEFSLEVYPA